MQSLWGGGIISRVNSPEEFWLNDLASLDTSEHRVAWMAGTPEGLGDEVIAMREVRDEVLADHRCQVVGEISVETFPQN